MLRSLATLVLFLAPAFLWAQPDAPAGKKEKDLTYRAIVDKLDTVVETKGLLDKVKFKVALEWLAVGNLNGLPIIVDKEAFLGELGADAPDLYEEEVCLPPSPQKLKAAQALNLLLGQVGKGQARYVIRNGLVEITTTKRASFEGVLAYPIQARFDKKPLEDALDVLGEISGATIVVDPRAGDKVRTPVSATFRGTITLEGAVRLLAEMADLQTEMQEGALFVTGKPKTPEPKAPKAKAELHFKNRRLDLAVQDLAAWSGQTVILDPAFLPAPTQLDWPFGGGRMKRLEAAVTDQLGPMGPADFMDARALKVTGSFKGNVPAKTVAEIIAAQVGLTAVSLKGAIYITRPFAMSAPMLLPAK